MAENPSYLAYHEPTIATILNLAGFLFALNLVNSLLDRLFYCGLIGQLFIGILWGVPGAKWLTEDTQIVIQQLGYLGLIALVYEGGLSVSFSSLRANIALSVIVAATGIAVPMGLSFVLMSLLSATAFQAFAAGAALSATSLGTTFTILLTTGLMKTRLGVVTTSAAMMDDVVGLVMVQVITNLGGTGEFDALTVVRPIVVSIGFVVGLVLLCAFVLGPLLKRVLSMKKRLPAFVKTFGFAFLSHTCVLFGIVAGATYAGASSLLAAYLAGATISWFDETSGIAAGDEPAEQPTKIEMRDMSSDPPETRRASSVRIASSSTASDEEVVDSNSPPVEVPTGELVYERYYKDPVNRILKPLFFASIGFAIPITEMFRGEVVWRGIVYTILMVFGKLVTGLWLSRISLSPIRALLSKLKATVPRKFGFCITPNKKQAAEKHGNAPNDDQSPTAQVQDNDTTPNANSLPPKPMSLYPSSILGLSMVARGEIGYLIASLAETGRVFAQPQPGDDPRKSSDIYLVTVWAITLCTLIGPISVGTLVRRVKKLQEKRRGNGGADPLGVWGI